MTKLFNDYKSKYSDEDIAKSRRGIRLSGLAFIAVGLWALQSELPLGNLGRGLLALFLAFIVPENRAAFLYDILIGMGLIFLVLSFMKPYGQTKKK